MTGLVKKNGTLALDTRRGLAAGCGAPQRGALAASQGLAEAYVYDAYGKVTLWGYRNFDFDRDGDVDSGDYGIVLGAAEFDCCPTSDPMTDGDMDGGERSERERAATGKASKDACVRPATCPEGVSSRRATGGCDENDIMLVQQTSSGAPPVTLYTSGVGNPCFFTGRRLHLYEDFALGSSVTYNRQVQHNRARHYDVENGRWLQRDSFGVIDIIRPGITSVIGGGTESEPGPTLLYKSHQQVDFGAFSLGMELPYHDGMNLYKYARNTPVVLIDPDGHRAKGPTAPKDPCKSKSLKSTDSGACQYVNQYWVEKFVVDSRCKPCVATVSIPAGTCVRRFGWPVDCVCKKMDDNEIESCIRAYLQCRKNTTGEFPDEQEHEKCWKQCSKSIAHYFIFLARLQLVISGCGRKEGCFVGSNAGRGPYSGSPCHTKPPGSSGGDRACCGCAGCDDLHGRQSNPP